MNDLPNGYGVAKFYREGNYTGNVKDGKAHGWGKYTAYHDNEVLEYVWSNGTREKTMYDKMFGIDTVNVPPMTFS